MKNRLDKVLVTKGLAETRSQAENYIKLGTVLVNKKVIQKPGFFVDENWDISLNMPNKYVSRAGLKLASVADKLKISFKNKTVLDVGSSTGGFTDFALQQGAKKVFAIDVGTNQMHNSLRSDPRIELHEQTDIRDFTTNEKIDTVVIDVSFISLREILPSVQKIVSANDRCEIIAMVKPQFEAGKNGTFKGIVKNNSVRRKIMKEFEDWCRMNKIFIQDKRDSEVRGAKGNQERFYKLRMAKNVR